MTWHVLFSMVSKQREECPQGPKEKSGLHFPPSRYMDEKCLPGASISSHS